MKTPGITVRPIQTIDGSHEVNEVFFDDVKVPVENRIYEENKGWDCAKFLLGNERSGIARVGASKAQVRRLKEIAAMERVGDKPLIEDERFAMKIAAIEVELKALEMNAAARRRGGTQPQGQPARSGVFDPEDQGLGDPAGYFRIADGGRSAPTRCRISSATPRTTAGTSRRSARIMRRRSRRKYFNWRKISIYGGSNEIQKNIIAKAILGL
jgi:alkylation response protein AidB-like acyl-CoA dehydrogenase